MPISKDEVRYVANLARLGLTEEEVAHTQGQLEAILGYVDKLKKLDVSGVPATAHVLDLKNVLRQDQVKPSLDPNRVLEAAPSKEESFFKVPKVIGET